MSKYAVVVGNVGTVMETDNKQIAYDEYSRYCDLSENGCSGRAYKEDVILFEDGEIIAEHKGDETE